MPGATSSFLLSLRDGQPFLEHSVYFGAGAGVFSDLFGAKHHDLKVSEPRLEWMKVGKGSLCNLRCWLPFAAQKKMLCF